MTVIRFEELRQNPDALFDRIEAGEHVVVVRDGRQVAELRPITAAQQGLRPVGLCAGEFAVPDDFDAPLPDDVLREFEG